jgi:hypothetical protein
VRFLCTWAKSNAPGGNPVAIRACETDGQADEQQALDDAAAWWDYWRRLDIASYEKLHMSFAVAAGVRERELEEKRYQAALAAIKLQRKEEEDAAIEKKKRDAEANRAARLQKIKSIPTMPESQLCSEFRVYRTQAAIAELEKRNSFNQNEFASIAARNVRLGISERALFCVLGKPDSANRSVGSWGVHVQYVYGGRKFFYTENGVVTSWQD